jgi:hypothetical protein
LSFTVLLTKHRHFDRSRSRICERRSGEIRFSTSTSTKPTPRLRLCSCLSCCHPRRGSAFSVVVSSTRQIVISTEAAHSPNRGSKAGCPILWQSHRKPGSPPALLVGWKGWVIRATREPFSTPNPKTCHPERSSSRTCELRSRRTCICSCRCLFSLNEEENLSS